MSYGFNNNIYEVVNATEYRDVFAKKTIQLSKGQCVGSAIVNAIIVIEADREATQNLEGQSYIDQMVELNYVKLI